MTVPPRLTGTWTFADHLTYIPLVTFKPTFSLITSVLPFLLSYFKLMVLLGFRWASMLTLTIHLVCFPSQTNLSINYLVCFPSLTNPSISRPRHPFPFLIISSSSRLCSNFGVTLLFPLLLLILQAATVLITLATHFLLNYFMLIFLQRCAVPKTFTA